MTMDNKETPTPLECAYNRMVKSTKTSGRINGEGYFTPNILIQGELKRPLILYLWDILIGF